MVKAETEKTEPIPFDNFHVQSIHHVNKTCSRDLTFQAIFSIAQPSSDLFFVVKLFRILRGDAQKDLDVYVKQKTVFIQSYTYF